MIWKSKLVETGRTVDKTWTEVAAGIYPFFFPVPVASGTDLSKGEKSKDQQDR